MLRTPTAILATAGLVLGGVTACKSDTEMSSSSQGPGPDGGAVGGDAGTGGGGGEAGVYDPLENPCAGLTDGDALGDGPPPWEGIECLPPEDAPCATAGLRTRTYAVCHYAEDREAAGCQEGGGGCGCGPAGTPCLLRRLVDSQPCPLTPPAEPVVAGPWGECLSTAPVNRCATAGSQSRNVQVCRAGSLVEEAQDRECAIPTEELAAVLGDWSPCAFPPDNPCAVAGTWTRSVSVCRGGQEQVTQEEGECTRETEGEQVGARDEGPCEELAVVIDGEEVVDACGAMGVRDVSFSVCEGGVVRAEPERLTEECPFPSDPELALSLPGDAVATLVEHVEIGGLEVAAAFAEPRLEACRLRRVNGDLVLRLGDAVQEVRLPGLLEVTGSLQIEPAVHSTARVVFEALERVRGDLVVRGRPVVEADPDEGIEADPGAGLDLTRLELPALVQVDGDVTVEHGAGAVFGLPVLAEAGGSVRVASNARLLRFDLPGLGHVGVDFEVRENGALTTAFHGRVLSPE